MHESFEQPRNCCLTDAQNTIEWDNEMLANQLQSIGYYKPVILSTIFVTAVRTVHAVLYKLLEMKIVVPSSQTYMLLCREHWGKSL